MVSPPLRFHALPAGELTPFGCLNGFWCNPAFGLADAGVSWRPCLPSQSAHAPDSDIDTGSTSACPMHAV